jgi:hypothetical protein
MRRALFSCTLALAVSSSLIPAPALSDQTKPIRPVMSRQDVVEETASSSAAPVIVALFALMLLIAVASQGGGSRYGGG